MSDGIVMTFLNRTQDRIDSTYFSGFNIPNGYKSIVESSSYNIHEFGVVTNVGARRGSIKFRFGLIRIVKVPDITFETHLVSHLLESSHTVTNCHLNWLFWQPGYFTHSPLDVLSVLILEQHQSLCVDILHEVFTLLVLKVFFK